MTAPMQLVPELSVVYVRASELKKLASPLLAGCGVMLNKEPGIGLVPLYLASPTVPPVAPPTVVLDTDEFKMLVQDFIHAPDQCGPSDAKSAWNALIAHITALIEAARVEEKDDALDAKRYRHFINSSPQEEISFQGAEYFGKDALDAAIDAAIKAEEA